MADGWLSYVVTPAMYKTALEKIEAATQGRNLTTYGTGHLLFACVDDTYEKALDAATVTLSARYAMDFRNATRRYAALGRPDQVAEQIRTFYDAGVRHIILDLVGPYEERNRQIERIAAETLPLLKDLRE
jgi:alkanesulfonate monooxygenase SsuD/methylene tetrahydromethanopterin reductase-like flavin-dependent oxidoreductase (luciferase family)